WDSGRNRVPWAAVRLLRLLRRGDLGALSDGWDGWTINRLGLHAPDGRTFRERDLRHLWLTLTQADLFRESYARARLGAAQPRERLEGASTFPREAVSQGENRTRETGQQVMRPGTPFPAEPALEGVDVAPHASAASGRRGADALFLVSYATTCIAEGGNGVAAPFAADGRGARMVLPWYYSTEGVHDDRDLETEPATAPGGPRDRDGGGRGAGGEPEHLHPARGGELDELPDGAATGGQAGGLSGDGGARAASGQPSSGGALAGGAEGRPESALPLRQRREVQAVPRATVGGLKCDTRPSLTADRVPRSLNGTGGAAPEGIMP